jgi:hypothetical protein
MGASSHPIKTTRATHTHVNAPACLTQLQRRQVEIGTLTWHSKCTRHHRGRGLSKQKQCKKYQHDHGKAVPTTHHVINVYWTCTFEVTSVECRLACPVGSFNKCAFCSCSAPPGSLKKKAVTTGAISCQVRCRQELCVDEKFVQSTTEP